MKWVYIEEVFKPIIHDIINYAMHVRKTGRKRLLRDLLVGALFLPLFFYIFIFLDIIEYITQFRNAYK